MVVSTKEKFLAAEIARGEQIRDDYQRSLDAILSFTANVAKNRKASLVDKVNIRLRSLRGELTRAKKAGGKLTGNTQTAADFLMAHGSKGELFLVDDALGDLTAKANGLALSLAMDEAKRTKRWLKVTINECKPGCRGWRVGEERCDCKRHRCRLGYEGNYVRGMTLYARSAVET